MVTSIESNHKNVPSARKGMEVCIKIEPYPGEAPKMFGRHFDETDMLVSKVSVVNCAPTDLGIIRSTRFIGSPSKLISRQSTLISLAHSHSHSPTSSHQSH